MSEFLENVSRSVPVLFYDLLTRICPGAVFLYFAGLSGKQRSPTSGTMEALDFIMLVFGGYIVGILLTVISSLMFDAPLELLGRLSTRLGRLSPNQIWDQIDSIDIRSERHAMLLVKVEAEMTFCQNLFVVFLALIALQRAGYLVHENTLFDLGKPVAWVVGSIILAAVVHRTLILFRRVRILTRLLGSLGTGKGESPPKEERS